MVQLRDAFGGGDRDRLSQAVPARLRRRPLRFVFQGHEQPAGMRAPPTRFTGTPSSSATVAAISAPNPATRTASCATTRRLVFAAEAEHRVAVPWPDGAQVDHSFKRLAVLPLLLPPGLFEQLRDHVSQGHIAASLRVRALAGLAFSPCCTTSSSRDPRAPLCSHVDRRVAAIDPRPTAANESPRPSVDDQAGAYARDQAPGSASVAPPSRSPGRSAGARPGARAPGRRTCNAPWPPG